MVLYYENKYVCTGKNQWGNVLNIMNAINYRVLGRLWFAVKIYLIPKYFTLLQCDQLWMIYVCLSKYPELKKLCIPCLFNVYVCDRRRFLEDMSL